MHMFGVSQVVASLCVGGGKSPPLLCGGPKISNWKKLTPLRMMNLPALFFTNIGSSWHHPPTVASVCLPIFLECASPRCIGRLCAPLWWQTWSGCIRISASWVASNLQRGLWPIVSACFLQYFPTVCPTRRKKGRSGGIARDRTPGTYDLSTTPLSGDSYTDYSGSSRHNMCSLHPFQ